LRVAGDAPQTIRVLSYGGGLDSFAMLLGARDRGDLPDAVVFVDVGDGALDRDGVDPAEWPGTYRHIREVVVPLCLELGVEFVWINSQAYPVRNARSLFSWLEARKQIPVVKPSARICTTIAKVERFEAWAKDRFPTTDIEVWIGFDANETDRAEKDPNIGKANKKHQRRNRFPLMEWGLCRCRCEKMVREAGYPVPRKSACVFCPFGTRADWKTYARELPESFARTVALEANKPPTAKNGAKLSIKNFRSYKRPDGTKVYVDTPLPTYIAQAEQRTPPRPCTVCGASERATKATGCDYLEG